MTAGNAEMECFVYVLGSCGVDGYRTYVGWTNDSSDVSRGIMRGRERGRRVAAYGSCCMRNGTTRAEKR